MVTQHHMLPVVIESEVKNGPKHIFAYRQVMIVYLFF